MSLLSLLLALTAVVGPAGSAEAQKIRPDFFGLHDTDWATTPPPVDVGAANFTTSGTYWPRVQTGRNTFDWTRLDAQVAAAEAKGAQPMIVLGQSPKFASTKPRSQNFDDQPPKMKLWQKYVSKVAGRYGARLDYQIWPEPNIVQNWTGTPRQMALLTVAASKAITRQAGRKATVVSPAMALRLKGQRKWTVNYFKQKVGRKRVAAYVDAVAIDPFPEKKGTPEDSYGLMRSVKKDLARVGVRKPFWNNEINYGVVGANEPTGVRYSVNKQQSYVIRTYVLSAAAGMKRTYWLGWFDSDQLGIAMADDSGAALPPGESYAVVRSWLVGSQFRGCRQKNGLWTCTAVKGRELRTIYWKTKGKATITTPRSTRRVEDQEGNVDARGGRTKVRVDYRPVMVAAAR